MISGVSPMPVGAVDLGAHFEQPFGRFVEADARRGDQRRVAALAGKVGIGALVEQEAGPFARRRG